MTERFLGITLAVWIVFSFVGATALLQPVPTKALEQANPFLSMLA